MSTRVFIERDADGTPQIHISPAVRVFGRADVARCGGWVHEIVATPAEARKIAADLVAAADEAES